MDRLSGIDKDLREDFAFVRRLENVTKSRDGQIWLKFCTENVDEEVADTKQSLFKSHPRSIPSKREILEESDKDTGHELNLSTVPTFRENELNDFVSSSDDLIATNILRRRRHPNEPPKEKRKSSIADLSVIGTRVKELYPPLSQSTIKSVSHEANKKKLKPVKCRKGQPYMKNLTNSRQKVKNYLARVTNNASPKCGSKRESVPTSQRSNMSSTAVNCVMRGAIQKCLNHISSIRSLIEAGIDTYEGQDDLPRRLKRMKEFSSRFSRIYLYPLVRHLDELSNMKLQSPLVSQKIIAAFHMIEKGLQAYHNHLPSSAGNCAYDKMKNLLSQSLKACSVYESLLSTTYSDEQKEYVEAFRHHIELLNEDFEYNFSSSKLMPKVAKENRVPRPIDKIRKPKVTNSTKKRSRLAMYNVSVSFRKDVNWEKTVDLITKKKYNVKSRYRTAAYKHRPAVEKLPATIASEKSMFTSKHCLPTGKTTPLASPIKDEEITTMVQVQKQKDRGKNKLHDQSKDDLTVPSLITEESDEDKEETWEARLQNVKENVNQECVTVKLLQLLRDKYKVFTEQTGNVAEDSGAYEFLRNCLANPTGDNKEILNTLIKELDSDAIKYKLSENVLPNTASSTTLASKCMKKISEISVTGPKNAKLYCIRDDRSITNDDDKDVDDNRKTSCEVLYPLKAVSTSQTQTDLKGEEMKSKSTQKSSKSTVKISRLPKANLRKLKLLESSQAVNIIQYKLDFKAYSKKNPMYDRTTIVPPWVITGRISDKLLEDALLLVTKEMEIDGLLENICRAEFQY